MTRVRTAGAIGGNRPEPGVRKAVIMAFGFEQEHFRETLAGRRMNAGGPDVMVPRLETDEHPLVAAHRQMEEAILETLGHIHQWQKEERDTAARCGANEDRAQRLQLELDTMTSRRDILLEDATAHIRDLKAELAVANNQQDMYATILKSVARETGAENFADILPAIKEMQRYMTELEQKNTDLQAWKDRANAPWKRSKSPYDVSGGK